MLLKNDGPLLPLRKHGQKIALIGPFARDTAKVEGPWTLFGDPVLRARPVLLDGLTAIMAERQARNSAAPATADARRTG